MQPILNMLRLSLEHPRRQNRLRVTVVCYAKKIIPRFLNPHTKRQRTGKKVNQAATQNPFFCYTVTTPSSSHPFPLVFISLSVCCSTVVAAAAVGGGREFEGREKMKYLLFIFVVHRYACRTRDPFSQ